jgi:hypothetical protein
MDDNGIHNKQYGSLQVYIFQAWVCIEHVKIYNQNASIGMNVDFIYRKAASMILISR